MATLFTIGYERSSPDLLVDALIDAGVSVLVDIRAVPVSRRRGFSKRDLSARIQEAGLRYRHMAALGNPKAGRDAGREGRIEEFRKIYAAQLQSDAAKAALVDLAALARQEAVCLLCYERDASQCHRSIAATALAGRYDLSVRDLTPETGPGAASTVELPQVAPRTNGPADDG